MNLISLFSLAAFRAGRTVARSGLRMMPTFPLSPLSFRTVGLPQYGWKAGLSDSAFAHVPLVKPAPSILSGSLALPLSFVHRAYSFNSRSESGRMGERCTTMRRVPSSTPVALAPVWVMLSQSINTYSATSAPLLGTSQFRRRAVYMRCLRCAGAPRRPKSGSVLSLTILSQHVALYDSGKFDGCTHPVPSPSTLAFVKA